MVSEYSIPNFIILESLPSFADVRQSDIHGKIANNNLITFIPKNK